MNFVRKNNCLLPLSRNNMISGPIVAVSFFCSTYFALAKISVSRSNCLHRSETKIEPDRRLLPRKKNAVYIVNNRNLYLEIFY